MPSYAVSASRVDLVEDGMFIFPICADLHEILLTGTVRALSLQRANVSRRKFKGEQSPVAAHLYSCLRCHGHVL